MRDPESQRIALECLKLAFEARHPGETIEHGIERARRIFAFVTGDESAVSPAAQLKMCQHQLDAVYSQIKPEL